ncbi:MAG: hypothetical protein LUD47_03295 [Clostridia bacterium]|nr:hypothetical protein [Clostridia bacterium]
MTNGEVAYYAKMDTPVSVKTDDIPFSIEARIAQYGSKEHPLWRIVPVSKDTVRRIMMVWGRGYNSHNNYYFFYPAGKILSIEVKK